MLRSQLSHLVLGWKCDSSLGNKSDPDTRSRELTGTVSFYCNVIRAYAIQKSMHLPVSLRVREIVLFCADITAIKALASAFLLLATN